MASSKWTIAGALLLIPVLGFAVNRARAAEPAVTIPAPTQDLAAPAGGGTQTIVLAGGCFWGVQGVFEYTKGVTSAVSGYSGGTKDTAHYEMVGTERTGHAESVQVTFDPGQISYGKILQIYFSVAHNPTELNYQGPDSGPSYRSAIFYANDEQKRIAEAYIAQLDQAHVFKTPIVTKLEAFKGFYPAEDYHQDFLVLHPTYPYIVINDQPKVGNLKRLFADQYRDTPVTVMASNRPSQ
jgi:peptide-methionine (S)-S-oxide reductase